MNDRIKLLLQYIDEDPGDAFSKYALALEYIREGNDHEASALMEQLYRNQSEYLPNYYHFGKLNERMGNFELSKEIYQNGIRLALAQGNVHTMNELKGALELLESD